MTTKELIAIYRNRHSIIKGITAGSASYKIRKDPPQGKLHSEFAKSLSPIDEKEKWKRKEKKRKGRRKLFGVSNLNIEQGFVSLLNGNCAGSGDAITRLSIGSSQAATFRLVLGEVIDRCRRGLEFCILTRVRGMVIDELQELVEASCNDSSSDRPGP